MQTTDEFHRFSEVIERAERLNTDGPVVREELLRLVAAVVDSSDSSLRAGSVAKLLARLLVRESTVDVDLMQTAVALFNAVSDQPFASADQSDVRRILRPLIPHPVITSVVSPDDGWSAVVLPYLSGVDDGVSDVEALLTHLASAAGSKPGKSWMASAAKLLDSEVARNTLRFLVDQLAHADWVPSNGWFVRPENQDVCRAAVWASVHLGEPSIAHRIGARGIAGHYFHDKIPNAAIVALGLIGTPESMVALQRLAESTRHNGFRTRIAAAKLAAAAAMGLTPGQVLERAVPTGGLCSHGAMTLSAGDITVRIVVDNELKPHTIWGNDHKPSATVANRVKRQVKELRDTIGNERRRAENLLAAGRQWDVTEWRRFYLDHPITGRLARRLLWRVETPSGEINVGIPTASELRTLDGETTLPDAGTVCLWHPATVSIDEVAAWRSWLMDNQLKQPFKQAFREVYLLTPAERDTDVFSNRFAGHVLRYQQTFALFKERAWAANYLNSHEGGSDGIARRELPETGFTAVFEHSNVDRTRSDNVDICVTDHVWFFRTGDRAKRPVPLSDVPPLVLSEAMRDVDLFVGVTSIAVNPEWTYRRDDPFYEYWSRVGFGDLSVAAGNRRDALARLLPKMAVADQVELGDRYVRIRGSLATYRVHIGSSNVLIEPDDRYLCIVPKSRTAKLPMLPFDGDTMLSLILSKVMLLAADHKIKDAAILDQIAAR